MASTPRPLAGTTKTTALLLLSLNPISFTLIVSSTNASCPPPSKPPAEVPSCPMDTLKLGVCVDLLEGLLGLVVGTTPQTTPCCSLMEGLDDVEAAVCLCTTIKASVLGSANVDLPLALSLLLDFCDKNVPSGFRCAA